MTKIMNGCAIPLNNKSKINKRFDLKYFNFVLLLTIVSLGGFYLSNISALTAQGFTLRELKSKMAVLSSDQAAKEEEVSRVQSYYSLNTRVGGLKMVAVGDDVEYLSGTKLTLAKK